MSFIRINGPAKSGKTVIANALRNYYITQRRGVLLIDENNPAETKDLVAKLVTKEVSDWTKIDLLPWKLDPVIIVIGAQTDRLVEIENIVPGFAKKFGGAVFEIETGKRGA